MSDSHNPEPGWYDDGTGRQRWFDGTEWGQYAQSFCGGCGSPCAGDDVFCGQCGHPVSKDRSVPDPMPADDEPVIIRRTRKSPFIAASEEEVSQRAGVTVSRNWSLALRSSAAKKDSGMTRNRKIAGDLPQWSPLPPGELHVDRTGGTRL